ncbi:MAG: transglutaminase domain-containing protein [Chloroflexota bacterium]|nr:transglutaminase domain-containing protein [Chloroflexota bacterium]
MSLRLVAWLWHRFRPAEGRFIFLFLVLAVLSAAVGGIAAEWVPGDELFWHTALVGVLLGRMLGRSRMQKRWAALLLAVGGLTYVGWCTTHLTSLLWTLLGAARRNDWPLALTWLREAGGRVAMLTGEIATWIGSWMGQGGTPGVVVSLFWMALLLWGGAAFAGWSIPRERHPLLAFIPLGGALTLSVYLGDAGMEYLLLFMACVMMMTPPMTLRREERRWDSRQIDYSKEFLFDVMVTTLLSVTIFIAVAIAFPNVRVWAAVDWFWQRVQTPQQAAGEILERAFPGARPATGSGPRGGGTVAELPREHLLGGSPDLERTVVMQVVLADEDPPPVSDRFPYEEVRPGQTFYWRGVAYSEYVGAGWKLGRLGAMLQPPYTALGPPERPGRRPLRQEFTLLLPHGETLYAAGDPHSVDRAVTMQRLPENGDLVAIEGQADNYHVLSLVPQVTAQELTAAPEAIPSQVAEVYLALPDGLPQRVIELAQEVTAEAETPYARASALEAYLRSFPYDLEIAKPPEGRDVVDYFLFDLQRGYCDYFASAMVVMARSVHIPARLAVGYAMGHYDPQREAYVVTEKNGHAWPELYFPTYGWIPFEPTSGLEPLGRAEESELSPPVLPSQPERPWWVQLQVEARLIWLRWRWWVLACAGVLAVLGAGWWVWVRERRPASLSGEEQVVLSYARLQRTAPRLGVPVRPSNTPAEFTAAMGQELARRRPHVAWLRAAVQREIEQALTGIYLVTGVYERVSYAPTLPDPDLMRQVWQEGHHLRRRLWRLWALSTVSD